jgi:hypothetical protein
LDLSGGLLGRSSSTDLLLDILSSSIGIDLHVGGVGVSIITKSADRISCQAV